MLSTSDTSASCRKRWATLSPPPGRATGRSHRRSPPSAAGLTLHSCAARRAQRPPVLQDVGRLIGIHPHPSALAPERRTTPKDLRGQRMTELARPTAKRLQRPSWRDSRLVAGVLLVLLAATLGAKAVASADDRVPVWAAAADLVVGDRVDEGSFARVDVL